MRDILGAFDFESDKGVLIWARPYWWDEEEAVREDGRLRIGVSLLTDKMVAEDRAFFDANGLEREMESEASHYYRPYMFEFVAVPLPHAVECVQELIDSSKWIRARLHRDSDKCRMKEREVCGDLLLSVKPYVVEGLCLSFLEDDEGSSTSPSRITFEETTCESEIDKMRTLLSSGSKSEGEDSFTVKVHNVGQANMVYVQHNNIARLRFYFDIGRPISFCMPGKGSSGYGSLCKKLHDVQMSTPSFVAVSHWHFDHVAAAFQLDPRVMDSAIWILPAKPPSGRRWISNLVGYLSRKSSIVWVDDSSLELLGALLQPYGMLLDRGTGSDLNDAGLMLCLGRTVLAADCDYSFWPDSIHNAAMSCQNLVVPHHGAAVKQNSSPAFLAITSPSPNNLGGRRGDAYISVDKLNNNYGHPSVGHLRALQRHWSVKRTDKIPSPRTLYEFQA